MDQQFYVELRPHIRFFELCRVCYAMSHVSRCECLGAEIPGPGHSKFQEGNAPAAWMNWSGTHGQSTVPPKEILAPYPLILLTVGSSSISVLPLYPHP